MLAYNITHWMDAPGHRTAHVVVTRETRNFSRRRARSRTQHFLRALDERPSLKVEKAIDHVILTLGVDRVTELVHEARTIHGGAGMLILDGTRKRTLGGVFFQLAEAASPRRPK